MTKIGGGQILSLQEMRSLTSPDAEAYGALGSMDNMAMVIKRRKLSTANVCQVENFLVMVLANGWWH